MESVVYGYAYPVDSEIGFELSPLEFNTPQEALDAATEGSILMKTTRSRYSTTSVPLQYLPDFKTVKTQEDLDLYLQRS